MIVGGRVRTFLGRSEMRPRPRALGFLVSEGAEAQSPLGGSRAAEVPEKALTARPGPELLLLRSVG